MPLSPGRVLAPSALLALVVTTSGCAGDPVSPGVARVEATTRVTPSGTPSAQTAAPSSPAPASAAAPGPHPSDGTPRRATLSIPEAGVQQLQVVPYVGWTDDAPGTVIQNRGNAASPHGPRGGVGPGGVGNYQVTAHRNTAGGPFFSVPDLRAGDRLTLTAAGVSYTYEITGTRETSFRSTASLAAHRAAVPGQPGVAPTRAMITISTCATQEDHAEGNYWSDELDNPEHRIDKIGVLTQTVPA
ncbi:MAG: sortase [Nocardioides sp.]|nr:sortase [Nocardioides sp.]